MPTERAMPMQTERMMPAQTVHGGMGNGGHLYASKLIGYRTQPDGLLEEITSVAIPYNSSQGLAGF